jgi:RNA recognition motif-containing protein
MPVFFSTFIADTQKIDTMNIFISNISFKVREQALQELFGQYGEVTSVRIIKDKETRRSKGYGFVEMANDGEAHNAISTLNGTMHYDRNIVVAEAKGKKEPAAHSPE